MSALPNSRTRRVEDYLYLFTTQSSFKATDSPMSILRKIINPQTQLPYSPLDPLKTFLNSYWFMEYILVQSHKIMDSWYLIPANYERNQFLNGALHRLQASSFGRWVILVAVGLIQSFLTGDMTQIIRHSYWIGHIENTVKHEMTRDLVPQEMQERRSTWVHTWRFQPGELSFTESWMMVAWYAVQESWRLALLVYLYMAVCNTSSDDPRVQSYIKQILQVVGTVKERGKSSSYVSFFVQYLI
ncbi:unnamed protein product [Rhizoctonia solani]|uniref:Uncharacterized protein n=1 Tax=Rhizoctonia solani TaxID=456999 RepID=A0A8H3HRY2_9AGAM|nr:unnamed protein product [Rhizoctonia solani]